MRQMTILLALLGLLLGACQSEPREDFALRHVSELEAAFEEQDSPAAAQKLLDAYENYVETHGDDLVNSPLFMERAADVHFRGGRFKSTADVLMQAIRIYPEAENAYRMAIKLANLYQTHLEQPEVAQTVYQAMVRQFDGHAGLDTIIPKVATLPPTGARMDTLLAQIVDRGTGALSFSASRDFITHATTYASVAPEAPSSADYLFRAAEVAGYNAMYEESIALYRRVHEQYPEHERAAKALFMRAFTYGENLDDQQQARALYEQFIAQYPEDDFVDDAQALLDNLGKTDEEILQSFEENAASE